MMPPEITVPTPVNVNPLRCQQCGAEAEPNRPLALCARCRTQLAQRPIPLGIKAAAALVLVLVAVACLRIPASVTAAAAFEWGLRDERKLAYREAEAEYQKAVAAFPDSTLVQGRLLIAALKAHDRAVARKSYQALVHRKLDRELAAEINAALANFND